MKPAEIHEYLQEIRTLEQGSYPIPYHRHAPNMPDDEPFWVDSQTYVSAEQIVASQGEAYARKALKDVPDAEDIERDTASLKEMSSADEIRRRAARIAFKD